MYMGKQDIQGGDGVIKKHNYSHNQYVKSIITCDFIRLHCKPITKKEYANW